MIVRPTLTNLQIMFPLYHYIKIINLVRSADQLTAEAAVRRCSSKQMFLKNLEYIQEDTGLGRRPWIGFAVCG